MKCIKNSEIIYIGNFFLVIEDEFELEFFVYLICSFNEEDYIIGICNFNFFF